MDLAMQNFFIFRPDIGAPVSANKIFTNLGGLFCVCQMHAGGALSRGSSSFIIQFPNSRGPLNEKSLVKEPWLQMALLRFSMDETYSSHINFYSQCCSQQTTDRCRRFTKFIRLRLKITTKPSGHFYLIRSDLDFRNRFQSLKVMS